MKFTIEIAVSRLRAFNTSELRKLDRPLVVRAKDGAKLAALVPYEQFIKMQRLIAGVHSKRPGQNL